MVRIHCLALVTAIALSRASRAQDFTNYVHDCVTASFSDNHTTAVGLDCAFNVTTTHKASLSIDNCLSFDAPFLVAHQGGGYVSKSGCSNCTGTPNAYQCLCENFTASIDLTTFIGVNMTDGNICCNAGTNESPAVRCGSLEIFE